MRSEYPYRRQGEPNVAGWCIVICMVIILIAVVPKLLPRAPTEFAQGIKSMHAPYEECKASAPEGFDCVMVPMMVSKEYLEKQK